MTPLTKEEIDELDRYREDRDLPYTWTNLLSRLFYTARLGAEFVKQTAQGKEKQ